MAKKQTRRSISVSRTTYEKLKSFCETNNISMSQFVENRVGDFLGEPPGSENSDRDPRPLPAPSPPRQVSSAPPPLRPVLPARPVVPSVSPAGPTGAPTASAGRPVPMTSAAARYAVEPPPPIIKRAEQPAPKAPAMPKANEIFTF